MKIRIKELHITLLIVAISIFLTGCQSKGEQKTKSESAGLTLLTEDFENTEHTDTQDGIAEENGFTLRGTEDVFIPFTDCVCEYDNGNFQIYTKYFGYRNEYFSNACTVIYLQTAINNMQIIAADEYCIDYENGDVYYVERDDYFDDFISIYKYYFANSYDDGHWRIGRTQIVNDDIVEKWLAEAFELALSNTGENFSRKRAYITALDYEHGIPILKGEASGVHEDSDEYCHVDWEINTFTENGEAVPHEKKIYDEEKDKEIFEACDKAFTEKDGGNWIELSDLKDWNGLVDWDSIQGYKEACMWIRVDINGDNLPELVSTRAYEDYYILPIDSIYTYIGAVMKPLDRVYWDPNDHTEFIYFGSTGNLIYESCYDGMYTNGWYRWCQFDEAWRDKTILELSYNYFWEETEYSDEEEEAILKEWFPDTYGSRGAGCYCYKSIPKTIEGNETELIEEEITLDEFLNEYEQITGFDYFEANSYYEFIR